MNMESVVAELTARIDMLESKVEEQEAAIDALRYEGPVSTLPEDDYDYYTDGEWDAL